MQFLSPKGYWSLLRKVLFDPKSLKLEAAVWKKTTTRSILIQFSFYNLCIIYSLITILILSLRFIVSDLYFPEAIWAQSLLISITIGIVVAFSAGIVICVGLIVGVTKNYRIKPLITCLIFSRQPCCDRCDGLGDDMI